MGLSRIYRETLDAWGRALGAEHPNTLTTKGNLASALMQRGAFVEAEGIQRETLDVWRRVLGAEHPNTLASTTNWREAKRCGICGSISSARREPRIRPKKCPPTLTG